jgi:hypothetical protein
MAGYTGPLLAVAAIGALGAYTPAQEAQRNVYSDMDDCRRDYPDGTCALEATRVVGPWFVGQAAAGASAIDGRSTLADNVITETLRGGFGGWACDGGEGGGGGG